MSQSDQIVSKSFQEFLYKARSLDLGPIAYQLMRSTSGPQWTEQRTKRAIAHYLAFLYLVQCYPDHQLTPTWDVDQVWHYHILDTHKYAEDCQQLFGRFVHHFPYFGARSEADRQIWHQAYALTQLLFRQHFRFDLAVGAVPADCEPLAPQVIGCASASQQRPRVDITLADDLLSFGTLPSA